jgi:hypothetical protein
MLPFQDPVYCVMADTRSAFELASPDVENLLLDFFVRHNLFRAGRMAVVPSLPSTPSNGARSACQCGLEWVDFGAGSGSASRSRVHMFRHSPDFQFKKRTTFAAFTASTSVAESSYAFSGTVGNRALRPFPQNGYENNSLVER